MEPPEPGGGAFTLIRDSSLSQIKERGEILTNTSAVVPDMTDTNASRAAVDAAEHYSAYINISTFTFTIFEDFTLVIPSMKLCLTVRLGAVEWNVINREWRGGACYSYIH